MRRIAASLLRLVPLDERGQRAVDETLRDWAHESEHASGVVARARVGARALTSILRALAGIAVSDGRLLLNPSFVIRLGLFLVLPCVVFALVTGNPFYGADGSSNWWPVKTWALTSAVVMFGPLAVFMTLATVSTARKVPAIGLAIAATVIAAAVAGWVVPAVNQGVREALIPEMKGDPAVIVGWYAEMAPADLVSMAWSRPESTAMTIVLVKSGLVASALVLALLGGAVAPLTASRRRRWIAGVVAAYAGLFMFVGANEFFGAHLVPGGGLIVWVAVAAFASALVFARRASRAGLQLA